MSTLVMKNYEMERVIEVVRTDPSKTLDALRDFFSLYASGLLLFIYFFSICIHCDVEGIVLKHEEVISSFIRSGILDFLGSIISSYTDMEIVVSLDFIL